MSSVKFPKLFEAALEDYMKKTKKGHQDRLATVTVGIGRVRHRSHSC